MKQNCIATVYDSEAGKLAAIDAEIGKQPDTGPTEYPPGSPEKIAVLTMRCEVEMEMFNPEDAKDKPC